MSSQDISLDEIIRKFMPEGHTVVRKVFARGVQVYLWNGSDWKYAGPLADLYNLDEQGAPLSEKIGTHYMHLKAPAWEFGDGRVIAEQASPIPGGGPKDVDWLCVELQYDGESQHGLMYTYVLRVKTNLGKAPDKESHPGDHQGQRMGIGYETYYIFLRKG